MPYLTRHGRKRGKERLGLPARAIARLLPKVLKDGTPRSAYVGRVRKYLDGLVNDPFYREARVRPIEVKVYGEHVFLFGTDDALITVLHVPVALRSALR